MEDLTTEDARVMPGEPHHVVVRELPLAISPKDNIRQEVLRHHWQGLLLVGPAEVTVSGHGQRLVRRARGVAHGGHNCRRDNGP